MALRIALAGLCAASAAALAQEHEELGKQLANPVSDLISVPLQLNYDEEIGADRRGSRWQLNVQPVAPFSLNPQWKVISRTIAPFISLDDVGGRSDSGLGDITQSFFFAPAKPGPGGLIWGAGPAFLLPTASPSRLGAEKWGVGPTAVVLKQQHGWTTGLLANHIWSFAGDDSRADVSSTFLQPFVSHTAGPWTFGANLESSYDWKGKEWSVPVNLTATYLTKFGAQPVSFGGGLRYWADSPDAGPRGWGLRFIVTFLFPR